MDTTKNTTQNENYSYTPHPTNKPQSSQIVYVQRKSKNWLLLLLGCGGCFLLLLCSCILPVLLLGSLSTSTDGDFSFNDSFNNIEQKTILEAGNTNSSQKSKIAVINITGEIVYSIPGDTYPSSANSNDIISQLKKAGDDSDINAVVMRWNSPGGYATAAEPICQAIKAVREKKPVYSFIDSQGASLAYLLPNCTQYIYARPAAITGSIGVIIQAIDFYGILEKLGGKVVFVTNSAGDQKTGQDIFTPGSETYKTYQKILDENYEYFLNKVYEGRKVNHPEMTKDELTSYADGRIFSGIQASEAKLVDQTAEFDEALSDIVKRENLSDTKVDIVEYEIVINPFAQLFNGIQLSLKSANLKNQVTKSEISVLMEAGVVSN